MRRLPRFATLLKSSEVAGTTPDIGQLYVGGQVIQNGKYLVALRQQLRNDYYNSLTGWQYVTDGYGTQPNGAIYAVPFGAGYWYRVYYNKALLEKAGITDPTPTTWSDLLALASRSRPRASRPSTSARRKATSAPGRRTRLSPASSVTPACSRCTRSGVAELADSDRAVPAWHQLFAAGLTNSDAPSLCVRDRHRQLRGGQGAR